jgi:xylobiose transport system substrate-binding protein
MAPQRLPRRSFLGLLGAGVGNDGYRDKLHVSMGTSDAPDVFYNWGGGSIRAYANDDLLVDLTPHFDEDPAWKDQFGDLGLQPPRTWAELLTVVERVKAAGIIPFALAGGDSWTELVWPEYLLDRIGGPRVFERIAAGEQGAWRDPAVKTTIDMIRDLVDRGGFGDNLASVRWEGAGASTLIAQGRAAMHLMGSWEYTNQVQDQPEYAKNHLGFTDFPTVDGGAGDPKAADPAFAEVVYRMVTEAPSFQLSWDQAIERNLAQPMLDALAQVFLGELDAEGFIAANEDAA